MQRGRGDATGGSLLGRVIFSFVRRRLGKVPRPWHLHAMRPALVRGVAFMEQAQEASGLVPSRLKRLAQTLVAARVGCPF
jgi:hypothetical protein